MSTNRDDVDRFHANNINFASGVVYIGQNEEGLIDSTVADEFIKNMILLDSAKKPNIVIIFNTLGGCTDSGLAMYDAIRNSKAHVSGLVYKAESMGAVILQACDNRVIMPNGRLMIHVGNFGFDETHAKVAYKWVEQAKKDDLTIDRILLRSIKQKKPKFTKKDLDELNNFDSFLSAKQAIAYGLVDRIQEFEE